MACVKLKKRLVKPQVDPIDPACFSYAENIAGRPLSRIYLPQWGKPAFFAVVIPYHISPNLQPDRL
jgi:hypothetical protein